MFIALDPVTSTPVVISAFWLSVWPTENGGDCMGQFGIQLAVGWPNGCPGQTHNGFDWAR